MKLKINIEVKRKELECRSFENEKHLDQLYDLIDSSNENEDLSKVKNDIINLQRNKMRLGLEKFLLETLN